jgi:hypothetical protein
MDEVEELLEDLKPVLNAKELRLAWRIVNMAEVRGAEYAHFPSDKIERLARILADKALPNVNWDRRSPRDYYDILKVELAHEKLHQP